MTRVYCTVRVVPCMIRLTLARTSVTTALRLHAATGTYGFIIMTRDVLRALTSESLYILRDIGITRAYLMRYLYVSARPGSALRGRADRDRIDLGGVHGHIARHALERHCPSLPGVPVTRPRAVARPRVAAEAAAAWRLDVDQSTVRNSRKIDLDISKD